MTRSQVRHLISLISDFVGEADKPYREKREWLLSECDESEIIAIEEFAAWFEPDARATLPQSKK